MKLFFVLTLASMISVQDSFPSVLNRSPKPTGIITGKVFDKKTKKPLSGTSVYIPKKFYPKDIGYNRRIFRTSSKADGTYILKVPKGIYDIHFSRIPYNGFKQVNVKVVTDSITNVDGFLYKPTEIIQ